MLTKEEIVRRIELNREAIRSFGVQKLSLFGSYARDEARRNSDVDLLVEFKVGRGLYRDMLGLEGLLLSILGVRIDLVKTHLVREELRINILGGVRIEAAI